MDPEGDQLVEIQVLVTLPLQLRHPFRRRPVNSHGDQLVRVRIVAGLFEAANHFRRHAVNAEGDQFVAVLYIQPRRANPRNELWRHAMNAEGNQFVAVGNVYTRRANAFDEIRGHTMNLESY